MNRPATVPPRPVAPRANRQHGRRRRQERRLGDARRPSTGSDRPRPPSWTGSRSSPANTLGPADTLAVFIRW